MQMRQAQNRAACVTNPNENWMRDQLKATGHKWTRQARWGFRIYDFWCARLGIAVEVDGREHDSEIDALKDRLDYERSGIMVLRVRNGNQEDADVAIQTITESPTWNERRYSLKMKSVSGGGPEMPDLSNKELIKARRAANCDIAGKINARL